MSKAFTVAIGVGLVGAMVQYVIFVGFDPHLLSSILPFPVSILAFYVWAKNHPEIKAKARFIGGMIIVLLIELGGVVMLMMNDDIPRPTPIFKMLTPLGVVATVGAVINGVLTYLTSPKNGSGPRSS